jgi:hypothetical protein
MRNLVIPDMLKISVVFPALQMLILSAAELQIRQDGKGAKRFRRVSAAGGRA